MEDTGADDFCSRCGLMKEEWSGNKGKGYVAQGETYCCKGCAEDIGCTCETDLAQTDDADEDTKESPLSPTKSGRGRPKKS